MLKIRGGKLIKPLLQKLRIGDKIEAAAKPIAVVFNMDCLDEAKKLRPQSPCWKKRQALNGE